MNQKKSTRKSSKNNIWTTLDSVTPYNFSLSTRLFSSNAPSEKECYRMALRLTGQDIALISVIAKGSIDHSDLRMNIETRNPATADQIEEAKTRVESILNLPLDLSPFYRFVRDDRVLSQITEKLRGLKPRKIPSIFEALVRIIIEQQISLAAAHRIQDKLIQAYGEQLSVEEGTFFVFPTPEQLALSNEENLRACGLSRNKASYILGIAQAVTKGTLHLEDLENEQDFDGILSYLQEIRGVGQWTAEMVILRGMGRYEAFPADDLGLRRTLSHFYNHGELMNVIEARKLAGQWGPWKGLAGFYLLVAEITGATLTDVL